MNKRDLLENIPPEAWLQRGGPNGYLCLWDLHPKWGSACFGHGYRRIYRDADPWSDSAGNFGFERPDGLYEFVLFSKVSPLHHYELQWEPFIGRGEVLLDGEPSAELSAQLCGHDPRLLELRNPGFGELIQFHLDTLESATERTRAKQEAAALDPWKRVLAWYGVIRMDDPETYQRRMHGAFRQFLDSTPPDALTLQHLQYFQSQRLLPEELPEIEPEEMPKLIQDIRHQQAQINNPNVAPRIPRILFGVNVDRLETVDMQALIVMGAIKDFKTFAAREIAKLVKRRPDIQKMWDTPNARAQVYQLPEIIAIMQSPEAMQERTEAGERQLRSQGALEGFDAEGLLMQQKMNQAYLGMMPQQVPPPPWRVYKPWDPNDPAQQYAPQQQGFMGGFDLMGVWNKLGF